VFLALEKSGSAGAGLIETYLSVRPQTKSPASIGPVPSAAERRLLEAGLVSKAGLARIKAFSGHTGIPARDILRGLAAPSSEGS